MRKDLSQSKDVTPMGRDPRQEPVQPFVHPSVQSPQARAYAESIAQRRGVLPKYNVPVAGGQPPPIPNLDSEHTAGMTMADQAARQRRAQGPAAAAAAGGIIEGGPPAPSFSGQVGASPGLPPGILAGDLLPEAAQNDPKFRGGTGSLFAANQPMLAYKYGVVRRGQHIPPQKLQSVAAGQNLQSGAAGADRKLSPETLEGLAAFEEFNRNRAKAESGELAAERAASSGPAGSSAETAGGTQPMLTAEEKKELLENLDDFALEQYRQTTLRDMLNNDEQKEIIEKRCKPLDLAELIIEGRVSQRVVIVPGVFEPEFQSYTGNEDLILKRLLAMESKSLRVSDRYHLDKYSLMGLTVALKSVNKVQLPHHEDETGRFNEELFWKKFEIVSKFNYHMLASLIVNFYWFDMRVRKLFVAEELGNG